MTSKTDYKNHLFALFNAGGGGTRLWPRSRNNTPKQFLKLFGSKTLTQITAERFIQVLPWEKIIIVTTSKHYKSEIKKELPKLPSENVIVEPARKNTAPAHGLGALFIYKRDPDAVIMTSPVDHLVGPDSRYLKTMKIAADVAFSDKVLVTVGVKPTYPHTGYGYIEKGDLYKRSSGRRVYKVEKFTEKPALKKAEQFLKSGNYVWNTSQFVWRADTLLDALKTHSPEVYSLLEKIGDSIGKTDQDKVMKEAYSKMPEIAIDYAVAERAKNFYLITADYNWTDIGDWKEVWENLPKDNLGNVIIDGDEHGGEVINLDTSDALIHTDGRLIAVVDVDNIIVVDTKNALLIASKSKAQNVKKIVNKLKKEKNIQYL